MVEFLKEMTIGNSWLWFHILGGGFIAKVLIMLPIESKPVLWVFFIAIAWEMFELYKDGVKGYSGGVKGWFADTLGDILGAVLMAFIVTF
jgi:hypothetical protein